MGKARIELAAEEKQELNKRPQNPTDRPHKGPAQQRWRERRAHAGDSNVSSKVVQTALNKQE